MQCHTTAKVNPVGHICRLLNDIRTFITDTDIPRSLSSDVGLGFSDVVSLIGTVSACVTSR